MENNSLNESYLNYGDSKISQNDFLNAASSNLEDYLSQLSWSNKRKQMFRDAYSNIMSQGVTGATNASGFWEITHNGNNIDLSSRSKKEQEMYGEAAYYIQLLMNKLVSSNKELEEKAKSKKSLFDNKYFTEHLNDYIGRNRFGGRDWTTNDYNELDTRGKNGLRDTTNRRALLSRMLQGYADSLKEEDLNFEGSPFTDLNDFRTRVNSVIESLNNNSPDLKEKLDSIGLRYSDWFNDGSNDPFQTDGYNGTYGEYYGTYLPKLDKLKQKELEKKQKALDKENYDNTLILKFTNPKMLGATSTFLKTKYGGDSNKLKAQLLGYALNDITKLTPDLLSELHGAYKYLAKDSIDDKTLKRLQSSFRGTYKNSPPNRFKKINGIDNLIWDSLRRLVIQINTRKQLENILNLPTDLFNGVKTLEELNKEKDKVQLQYLNNTEWTADLTRELMGIAADVASVIDPEPFTAGGLALTGTGLRTYNRATDADGFTLSDAGHTTLDAGLSLLGMIPVVGDAALTARVVGKLLKAAGWLGAAFAATSVPQAAKAAWNKVVNGQDMTVDDWRAIGNVLMGVTQARRIQLNRAAGNAVKNQGGATTKEKVGEVEVKINGKTEKVEIDETSAKELQQAYKAAGSNLKATTEALRKSRKVREQLETKKTSDGKPAYTKEQLDAMEAPQAASGSVRGRIPGAHDTRGIKITERSVQTSGTPISELNLGPLAQMRINAILNNTGWFNRGDFGWNMRGKNSEQQSSGWLNRMWLNLKNPYKPKTQKQQEAPKTNSTEVPKTTEGSKASTETPKIDRLRMNELKEKFGRSETESSNPRLEYNQKQQNKAEKEIKLFEKNYGTNNSSSKNPFGEGYGSNNNTVKNGELNIDLGNGIKFNFKVNNAAEYKGNLGKVSTLRGQIAKKIKEQLYNKNIDHVKMGNLLKELKRKGWLKQGGTIDKQKIQQYKEFIKK